MTTAQEVFELTMYLMDEGNPSSGKADVSETREYKNRTIPILNILRVEVYPYSDTCSPTGDGTRPMCPRIVELEEPMDLDDGICQGVLPYGLAARLLVGEDDSRASYFQQCYEEKLAQLAGTMPAAGGEIEDLYGGIGMGQFSHW